VPLTLFAVLAASGAGWAAPVPDDDAALRKRLLALNEVTGDEPIHGQILALLNDPAGTKKLLPTALAMAKEKEQQFNYTGAYIVARAAHRLKEVDPAQAFYRIAAERALQLGSSQKLLQAYGGLIDMLYENKKFAESEKVCKEFLELKEDGVQTMQMLMARQLIRAQAKQGKFKEANKFLETLLRLDDENWLTLELKAWVQREEGQLADAAATYEKVLAMVQKDDRFTKEERGEYAKEIRYLLSNVFLDLKKVDKVSEYLEALLKEEPDNPTFNNDLGYIWADHGLHLEKAEQLIRRALDEDRKLRKKANPNLKPEEDKDNAAYLDSLGWVLFKQQKYAEAKKYLQQAAADKEGGQHVEILDHLGDVHLKLGEKAEAVAAWKKAVAAAGASKREQQKKAEVEKKLKEHQ
jgi:Tfp pilus assembly protein PilF